MSNIQEHGPLMDKIHCFDSEIDLGAALRGGGGGVLVINLLAGGERDPEDISPSPSPGPG